MKFSKPTVKPPTIQVTAKDMETGKTKTRTFYEVTPQGFWEHFDRMFGTGQQARADETAPTAAAS